MQGDRGKEVKPNQVRGGGTKTTTTIEKGIGVRVYLET